MRESTTIPCCSAHLPFYISHPVWSDEAQAPEPIVFHDTNGAEMFRLELDVGSYRLKTATLDIGL